MSETHSKELKKKNQTQKKVKVVDKKNIKKGHIEEEIETMIKEIMSIWKRSRNQTLNLLITLGYDAFKDNQRFNNTNLFAKTFEQFLASESQKVNIK